MFLLPIMPREVDLQQIKAKLIAAWIAMISTTYYWKKKKQSDSSVTSNLLTILHREVKFLMFSKQN